MAFLVDRTVEWQAGPGTPVKYSFSLHAYVDVVSVTNNIATISINGTWGVQNNPLNSRNSYAASDIALLTIGNADPWNYAFTAGESYYERGLPFSPNAPQSVVNAILVQFRGDTWRSDPDNSNNRSSLYYKPSGVVLNSYDGSSYQSGTINTTFQVDVSSGGNVPLLVWTTSGASSSTSYSWIQHASWASWFDLDYRPGKIWDGSAWQSHNRGSGAANIRNNSSFQTMRTVNGASGQDNPPLLRHSSAWYNMRRIGEGA